ncbi:hypothetical protein [Ahrensia sp. R2A130]|uniref:hypothetical protein n=1 Tax=Ahrensia sp. R2A130 TaxID=744979 RepID=UPI0001E0E851|nr:hypothetical protein [Ahrensia sp. R2A130]EFL90941.1 hypothetical protein R2A130_2609 [Ahrensia sp. R2A130]
MAKKIRRSPKRAVLPADELGNIGESLFQGLAAVGRLVANKSGIDQKGWDYVVQPARGSIALSGSLDQRLEWSSNVQVKTTAKKGGTRIGVKISTLELFAKRSEPSLIIVLVLETDGEPKRGYIISLIGKQLKRVLRRLRQAEAQDDPNIAKQTLSFDYKKVGRAFKLTGEGLREAIEAELGSDHSAYIVDKQRQLQELGYEDAELVGQVAFRLEDENQLGRIYLGLEPIRTEAMKVFDARF